MKTILSKAEFGCYTLAPVNKRIAARLLKDTGNASVLFQTDWDFPALARNLGWNGKIGRERCHHSSTDGTIDCPDCGRKAGEFIQAVATWLDAHDGAIFVGKGEEYFQ